MLTITYAVDSDTGQVFSRVEGHPTAGLNKVCVPVLEYEKIGEDGDFTKPLTYRLEAMEIEALLHARLRWTRKVAVETKNEHRSFWGMKPLSIPGDRPS
jgi:hypothetical protein